MSQPNKFWLVHFLADGETPTLVPPSQVGEDALRALAGESVDDPSAGGLFTTEPLARMAVANAYGRTAALHEKRASAARIAQDRALREAFLAAGRLTKGEP